MAMASFLIISISAVTSASTGSLRRRMMSMAFLVARAPAALASMVGMPMASWVVLVMTWVAPPSTAMMAPATMTPYASASLCGKACIHWWGGHGQEHVVDSGLAQVLLADLFEGP